MKLRIQPWPFKKDEEVQLYWICSPFLDTQNGWMLQVVFKRADNSIAEVTVPWGTIPYLTVGQKYINGIPINTEKFGQIYQITTPDRSSYQIGISYDIPASLYYFYKNQKYGFQRICKFAIGDRNYFIPCLELVRNFLTPHKLLANSIMKPGGLDLLIESGSAKEKRLFLKLTNEIKGSLVSNDTAVYLAWLKYDNYANKAWHSIYNKVFSRAVVDNPFNPLEEIQKNTYIDLVPPVGRDSRWVIRGINVGKDTLIFEIISKTNLYMPFDEILYTHPSLTSVEYSKENKKARIDRNGYEKVTTDLDELGEGANKTQDENIVDNISIGFGFNKNPHMEKIRLKNQNINTGNYDINVITRNYNQGEANNDISTTQDWIYGGKVKPLEFNSLEIMKHGAVNGLDHFLKMINLLAENHQEFEVSLNIILIPEGRVFSYYQDGERRNCAIVKLERKGRLPCYIVEIGRADGWSISTLLFYQLVKNISQEDIDEFIQGLLIELVDNGGHWEKRSFEKEVCFRFDLVRHISGQMNFIWMERICSKYY